MVALGADWLVAHVPTAARAADPKDVAEDEDAQEAAGGNAGSDGKTHHSFRGLFGC